MAGDRRFLSEELDRCATLQEAIASSTERILRPAPSECVVADDG